MWKRLQRIGKEAYKFQFTASYQDLIFEFANETYKPDMVRVVWSRRRRRRVSEWHRLVPSEDSSRACCVLWVVPENIESVVTLFRDPRRCEFEDKDWSFSIEVMDEGSDGGKHKDKVIASQLVNLKLFATIVPSQSQIEVHLQPASSKVVFATLHLTLSCVFLRQGKATDDDMQSLASLMSLQQKDDSTGGSHGDAANDEMSDVANMADVADDDVDAEPQTCHEPILTDIRQLVSRMNVFNNVADCVTGSEVNDQCILDEALAILSGKSNGESPVVAEKPAVEIETESSTAVAASKSGTQSPEELLNWCIEVTRGYQGIKLTNWTTSWRNGLAFCAIINRFRPDLINYSSLSPRDIHTNNKLAFNIAEQLGVARLLNADDMLLLVVPDKLNVMTFVYQLRAQLTGCGSPMPTLHSPPSPPSTSSPPPQITPSSSTVASGDWLSNLCPLTATEQQAVNARYAASQRNSDAEARQPLCHAAGKQLLACVAQTSELAASPTEPIQTVSRQLNADSTVLMTRQQLLNPFDSDSEDCETKSAAVSSPSGNVSKHKPSLLKESMQTQTVEKASPSNVPQQSAWNTAKSHEVAACNQSSWQPAGQSADSGDGRGSAGDDGSNKGGVATAVAAPHRQCGGSRREQLRERARQLLAQARHDAALMSPSSCPVSVDNEDERRQRLRERARRLIAESRAGAAAGSTGITQVITVHSRKAIGGPDAGEMYGCDDPLQQRQFVNKLSTTDQQQPGSPSSPAAQSYAEVEIEFLERCLARLDERAAGVEWSLRRVMDSQRNSNDEVQQKLMYEWFALVDERGELVKRIEQLNTAAQEQDLERRFELLSVELRRLMADRDENCDSRDDECTDRERLLLAELMSIVNQRDAIVQQLDKQEQETPSSAKPAAPVTDQARKSSRQESGCSMQ